MIHAGFIDRISQWLHIQLALDLIYFEVHYLLQLAPSHGLRPRRQQPRGAAAEVVDRPLREAHVAVHLATGGIVI